MKVIYKWIRKGIQCFILISLTLSCLTCTVKTKTFEVRDFQDSFILIQYDPTMPIFGFFGPQDIVYGKPESVHFRGSVERENGIEDEPLLTQDMFFNSKCQVETTLKYNNDGPAEFKNFEYSNSGKPIVITTIYFTNNGNSNRTVQYFDNAGGAISATDKWMGDDLAETLVQDEVVQTSKKTSIFFNTRGQIVEFNEGGGREGWVYDEGGRLISRNRNNQTWIKFRYHKETDQFGNWTKMEYEQNQTKYIIRRNIIYQTK